CSICKATKKRRPVPRAPLSSVWRNQPVWFRASEVGVTMSVRLPMIASAHVVVSPGTVHDAGVVLPVVQVGGCVVVADVYVQKVALTLMVWVPAPTLNAAQLNALVALVRWYSISMSWAV